MGIMTRWPDAVLRHDAHLLRERRAPHRARVHDGRGRRAGPVAAALGRRRRASSPAPTSTASRSSGPPRRTGITPAGVGRPRRARAFRDAWDAARHHLRRLHPHHRAPPLRGGAGVPPARLRQRRHRARHLRGPLLRRAASLLHRGRARRRQRARSTARPVEHVTEENYFFQLSRYEDRLLEHYDGASRGGAARRRGATRCSASSSRACATSR